MEFVRDMYIVDIVSQKKSKVQITWQLYCLQENMYFENMKLDMFTQYACRCVYYVKQSITSVNK